MRYFDNTKMMILLIFLLSWQINALPTDQMFVKIDVVHINDFHSRFEETDLKGSPCTNKKYCVGGFSRLYKEIKHLKESNPNVIVLNAGDNFQGTIWYNVHKWKVITNFMNKLPFDAVTLGNHEFDDNIKGVVPFINASKAPVVVCNVDDTLEPDIQNIYTKSVVIERQGKKIGLIGVITKLTEQISSSGKVKFLDESLSVNSEAARLVKEEGVFTNIVISHSGYEVEKLIAEKSSSKISLIVGGHSHTYLGEDNTFNPKGPYPTIIKRRSDGKTVLVTQASAHCRHIGNISITYDSFGNIVDWEGSPIFLSNAYSQDEQINKELLEWKSEIEIIESKKLGETMVPLEKSRCKFDECLFGNFVTDVMVYSYLDDADEGSWTYAAIALFNPGGLRANINIGNITYRDIITAQPFENTFDVSDIQGKYIKEIFEVVAGSPYDNGNFRVSINMLQVSGIQVVIDLNKQQGSRVQTLKVRCNNCSIPIYEDLDLNKVYRILTPSFLTNGGDGFKIISENIENTKIGNKIDMDIFERYLKYNSPVYEEIWGRIKIIGKNYIQKTNVN